MRPQKFGRNDPCPCWSGLKYKQCCLRKGMNNPFSRKNQLERGLPEAMPEGSTIWSSPDTAWSFQNTIYTPAAAMAVARGEPLPHSSVHPWVIAQLRERTGIGPGGGPPRFRISTVRGMNTAEICAALARLDVVVTRATFLESAATHISAWALSETWDLPPYGEPDFAGLAACELWRRWLSERPSLEMLDEWMQAGFELNDDTARLVLWMAFHEVLLAALPPEIDTIRDADDLFPGLQSIWNWMNDFEQLLHNRSLADRSLAEAGLDMYTRLVERFSACERRHSLMSQRAAFFYMLGDSAAGEALLREVIAEDPDKVNGYATLAFHLSAKFSDPNYRDEARAVAVLEEALARPVRDAEGWDLQGRIDELRAR